MFVARRGALEASMASGSANKGKGVKGKGRYHATSSLARAICPASPDAPPPEVRVALERFLQAVVRVTGGDTLLPDALADASLLAFRTVAQLVRDANAAAAKWAEEAQYGRDPDLAKKRGQAEARDFIKRKKAALIRELGPVSDQHLNEFDAACNELVTLQDVHDPAGTHSCVHTDTGTDGDWEFGSDLPFAPPGRGRAPKLSAGTSPEGPSTTPGSNVQPVTQQRREDGGADEGGTTRRVSLGRRSCTRGANRVRDRVFASGLRSGDFRRRLCDTRGGGFGDDAAQLAQGTVRGDQRR